MWVVWVGIFAWKDSMGQHLLSAQKQFSHVHYRNISTLLAASIFVINVFTELLHIQIGTDVIPTGACSLPCFPILQISSYQSYTVQCIITFKS
jgi:hypothetical protein